MNIVVQQILTHIVGFLLLLWLLKKHAWGPILQLLEDRRAQIAADLSAALASREAARKSQNEYDLRIRDVEKESVAKVQAAVVAGEKMARDIVASARKEADLLLEKAKENIDREVSMAKLQLRNDIAEMVISTTEKVIRKRMDAAQNRELVFQYMDELK
ncbi:MAG: F0F1 ATP synthase subunit B [Nitrospirota bacterium]